MTRDTFAAKGEPPNGVVFDRRELGTVLAGLRKIQREGYDEHDAFIASDNEQHELLSQTEIDELCERINV